MNNSWTLAKTAGSVTIAGYDIDREAREVRNCIGIIFQKPSLDLAFQRRKISGFTLVCMECMLTGLDARSLSRSNRFPEGIDPVSRRGWKHQRYSLSPCRCSRNGNAEILALQGIEQRTQSIGAVFVLVPEARKGNLGGLPGRALWWVLGGGI